MVRFCILYAGDDLEAEREIIINQVMPSIQEDVRKNGFIFDFQELSIYANPLTPNDVFKTIHDICNDKNNDTAPCIIVLLGDKCGYVNIGDKHVSATMSYHNFFERIMNKSYLTFLVNSTESTPVDESEITSRKSNQAFKDSLVNVFEEKVIHYRRTPVSDNTFACDSSVASELLTRLRHQIDHIFYDSSCFDFDKLYSIRELYFDDLSDKFSHKFKELNSHIKKIETHPKKNDLKRRFLIDALRMINEIFKITEDEQRRLLLTKYYKQYASVLLIYTYACLQPSVMLDDFNFDLSFQEELKQNRYREDEVTFIRRFSVCFEFFHATEHCALSNVSFLDTCYMRLRNARFGLLYTIRELCRYSTTYIRREFKKAFAQIKTEPSIAKARFMDVAATAMVIGDVIEESLLLDTDFFCYYFAIACMDYGCKSVHNLYSLASETKDQVLTDALEKLNLYERVFGHMEFLVQYAKPYPKLDKSMKESFEALRNHKPIYFLPHLASLKLFAKSVDKNKEYAKDYIKATYEFLPKHWCEIFTYLKKEKSEQCQKLFTTVGKFICERFDELSIRRFVYNSNFYKCIAMDYAYSTGQKELARKILYLGYDRYFEIDTLYLLKQHDEELFYEEIKKLKRICLKRNIHKINDKMPRFYCSAKLFGYEFCKEFRALAKDALTQIELSPLDDPRRIDEHHVPDWA